MGYVDVCGFSFYSSPSSIGCRGIETDTSLLTEQTSHFEDTVIGCKISRTNWN